MDLQKVIELFDFAITRVYPDETYLIKQMQEAIVFLSDMGDRLPASTIKVELPKNRDEHPSKTDPFWVPRFLDIINRLLPISEKVTNVMVINYFNSDDEHLHRHVCQHHLVNALMGIEVIEMVEQAVTNRKLKSI